MIIVTSSFSKSFIFKMFSVHTNNKAGVLEFLGFEERFQNAFMDSRPNWRKKAPFSNSSNVA